MKQKDPHSPELKGRLFHTCTMCVAFSSSCSPRIAHTGTREASAAPAGVPPRSALGSQLSCPVLCCEPGLPYTSARVFAGAPVVSHQLTSCCKQHAASTLSSRGQHPSALSPALSFLLLLSPLGLKPAGNSLRATESKTDSFTCPEVGGQRSEVGRLQAKGAQVAGWRSFTWSLGCQGSQGINREQPNA